MVEKHVTTEFPITVTLDETQRELTLHLRFDDKQWPDIKQLAKGAKIKLKVLSFTWETVKT